jgi:hypothetical protein
MQGGTAEKKIWLYVSMRMRKGEVVNNIAERHKGDICADGQFPSRLLVKGRGAESMPGMFMTIRTSP